MVEFGTLSRGGLVFRVLKFIERRAVGQAQVVLVRSRAGSNALRPLAASLAGAEKFFVVRNGRDASRFCLCSESERIALRLKMGIAVDAPVIIYVGSLGPKYCLIEMLALFQDIRFFNNRSVMIILSGELGEYNQITDPSLKIGVRAMHVSSDEVPGFLQIADLGLSLIKQTFSMTAASAVKTGEYLLCGVPVVATKGVGDIGAVLTGSTGILMDDPRSSLERGIVAKWFLESVLPCRERYRLGCRELGLREFALSAAVADFSRAIGPLVSVLRS
jgi:glycosyltransferase involved in cell wall biosynthesis